MPNPAQPGSSGPVPNTTPSTVIGRSPSAPGGDDLADALAPSDPGPSNTRLGSVSYGPSAPLSEAYTDPRYGAGKTPSGNRGV